MNNENVFKKIKGKVNEVSVLRVKDILKKENEIYILNDKFNKLMPENEKTSVLCIRIYIDNLLKNTEVQSSTENLFFTVKGFLEFINKPVTEHEYMTKDKKIHYLNLTPEDKLGCIIFNIEFSKTMESDFGNSINVYKDEYMNFYYELLKDYIVKFSIKSGHDKKYLPSEGENLNKEIIKISEDDQIVFRSFSLI